MLSKKIYIAVGSIIAAALLAAGGYFAKNYFDDNYVLLNMQEVAELQGVVELMTFQAFSAGQATCSKTL